MTKTIDDLVSAVKQLAIEFPQNTYGTDSEDNCFYAKGQCSNGSIGCIMGQAMVRVGIPLDPKWDKNEGECIDAVCDDLWDLNILDKDVQFLAEVQRLQDVGNTWEDAVETADRNIYD